jgi:hypothetical protein
MGKSRRSDYEDRGSNRIRHNEKDVNKIRKSKNNLYKYIGSREDDFDDDFYYDTTSK